MEVMVGDVYGQICVSEQLFWLWSEEHTGKGQGWMTGEQEENTCGGLGRYAREFVKRGWVLGGRLK